MAKPASTRARFLAKMKKSQVVTWIAGAMRARKSVFWMLLIVLGTLWLAQPNESRPTDRGAKPAQTVAALAPVPVSAEGLVQRSISSSAATNFTLFDRPYPVLAMRLGPADAQGVRFREWLLQTDQNYGPIRVEEQVRTDAVGDRETVVKREAFIAGEILAKPRDGVTREAFAAALAQAGAVAWQPIFGSAHWLVRFPSPGLDTKPQALAALARFAETVAAAEGNGLGAGCLVPDDPRFSVQYSMQNTGQNGGLPGADVRMVQAWDICRTSPDVIVAILDNGFDFSSPDLATVRYRDPREIPGNGIDEDGNGFVDDWSGWDFVDNDNDPDPTGDHGTTIASIIGAKGNNGSAIAGVTWAVQILPVKVTSGGGGGTGTTANLVAGINYARTKGARIMSMSLAGYPYSAAMLDAVEAARTSGILLVCAAANGGTDNDLVPMYPGSYPSDNILAVANTNNLDQLNLSASCYGLRSVDLGAPGTSIATIGRNGVALTGTGTSNSTPLVAGVAALLLQMRPEATVADLKGWILNTVDPLPSLAGRCVSGGRLNAYAALSAAQIRPTLTAQPISCTATAGGAVQFTVTAASALPLTYQWQRNGAAIAGATSATLALNSVTASDAGDYTVVVSKSTGSTTSQPARLVVATPEPGRLIGLSVRSVSRSRSTPLIVGVNVVGGSKTLLIRGIGPTLAQFGVPGALPDPLLEVHATVNGLDTIAASNDNWGTGDVAALRAAFAATGAFPLPDGATRDAALLYPVEGLRTIFVYDPADRSGVTLAEVYDTGGGNSVRLASISARNFVGTGDNILIAGFAISGNVPKRLLIRGVGPGLAGYGVSGALADPKLEIYEIKPDGSSVLFAGNDNWGDGDVTALRTAFTATQAFALPDPASKDAALLVTLPAGMFTALVSGVGDTTGEALVEVYDVDP